MKKKKEIWLSQCMIVKNEEENIRRALSWGKGIVDEQIVVDTGSTDRTVELAREMGAKVYHFTWIDDFSAAKNFAIEKAKGRWIAFLDADEYFLTGDAEKLKDYIIQLDGGPYGQILTSWLHVNNQGQTLAVGTQVRVFINAPYLRYHRRIHEYLYSTDPQKGIMVDAVSELTIFHTGYGQKENERKNKENRNLKLIRKELEDQPEDCDMLGYLGDEYYSRKEDKKAKDAFYRSIEQMPEQISEYDVRSSLTFTKLLEILVAEECPLEEFMEVYEKAREKLPKEADFDYLAGAFFMNRKEWEKGRSHLKQALSILEQYGNTSKSMAISGQMDRAYEMLALCCYQIKDFKECVYYASTLLGQNRYRMEALRLLMLVFCEKGKEEGKEEEVALQVRKFLEKIYDHSLKDRLFMIQGAKRAGYAALISSLRELFSPEELQQIDRTLA